MDYIEDKHLFSDKMTDDERRKSLDIMANLQSKINHVNAGSFNLPKFTKKLEDEIKRTPYLDERIKNPQPNQVFTSFEHVVTHYINADFNPFEFEHVIDTANSLSKCFSDILEIINAVT